MAPVFAVDSGREKQRCDEFQRPVLPWYSISSRSLKNWCWPLVDPFWWCLNPKIFWQYPWIHRLIIMFPSNCTVGATHIFGQTHRVWTSRRSPSSAQRRKIMAQPNGAVQRICRVSKLYLTEGRIFLKQLWSTWQIWIGTSEESEGSKLTLHFFSLGTWMPRRSYHCSMKVLKDAGVVPARFVRCCPLIKAFGDAEGIWPPQQCPNNCHVQRNIRKTQGIHRPLFPLSAESNDSKRWSQVDTFW